MTAHIKSELSSLSELIFSLLFTACVGVFCVKSFDSFPWLAFIGITFGLALMVACWEQKKNQWTFFVVGLLINTFVWSVFFNWKSFF
ncbi:F0F1-type ATP synthase assembly protein I [Neobacillus niacini]|nr:F0F1-type ATP synthase assembly protein I [Neobacillus niacini]